MEQTDPIAKSIYLGVLQFVVMIRIVPKEDDVTLQAFAKMNSSQNNKDID